MFYQILIFLPYCSFYRFDIDNKTIPYKIVTILNQFSENILLHVNQSYSKNSSQALLFSAGGGSRIPLQQVKKLRRRISSSTVRQEDLLKAKEKVKIIDKAIIQLTLTLAHRIIYHRSVTAQKYVSYNNFYYCFKVENFIAYNFCCKCFGNILATHLVCITHNSDLVCVQ